MKFKTYIYLYVFQHFLLPKSYIIYIAYEIYRNSLLHKVGL